ncbi:MAG: class I SAM-dependent methyltransferase [Armatimonadota bacterium]
MTSTRPAHSIPPERRARRFYEERFRGGAYAAEQSARGEQALRAFVSQFGLERARVLEVGCGRGRYQGMVQSWIGVDVATSCARHIRRPFVAASGAALPFKDDSFDALWSLDVLEHIPRPELALTEARRVVRSGGYIFLSPAWQVRAWAAQGCAVRSYRELDWRGRLTKLTIPVRDSVVFRAALLVPRRLVRHLLWTMCKRPTSFLYRELRPNYEVYWTSDSDACNSMDPYEAVLWFVSRGDECLSHPTPLRALSVRTGALTFRVRKRRGQRGEVRESHPAIRGMDPIPQRP